MSARLLTVEEAADRLELWDLRTAARYLEMPTDRIMVWASYRVPEMRFPEPFAYIPRADGAGLPLWLPEDVRGWAEIPDVQKARTRGISGRLAKSRQALGVSL